MGVAAKPRPRELLKLDQRRTVSQLCFRKGTRQSCLRWIGRKTGVRTP